MQHSLEQSSPDSSKESGAAAAATACGGELMDRVWLNQPSAMWGSLTRDRGFIHRKRGGTDSLKGRERLGRVGWGGERHQDGGRRMGQGRVSRLSLQKVPHLCPLTELLQVVMHYIYFPINSIAHLTAYLYSTFAIRFFLRSLRVGILCTGHLQHSRSFPHLWSTNSHLCNLLWQCTSPFIKTLFFK